MFITGAAKSLFVPLAMAVVFAMLTSYFLSRTLVPTLVRYLLAKEAERARRGHHGPPTALAARFFAAFDRGFERLRDVLRRLARAGRSQHRARRRRRRSLVFVARLARALPAPRARLLPDASTPG